MKFLQSSKKAVAYYRHSAEDKQENSVQIQREHAEKFAAKHNIEIIHEEADEGVSGLIANRPGFKRLFSDWVYNLNAPKFDYVLFFDISRWGRFQDQNEGAHYAFMCKKHGKTLVNVFRGFPQEGQQLTTSLIDSIDRFMAAEYSRVLSEKVWHGSMKISRDGFSAGGTAPYGMARLLLDENRKPVSILKKGQHKLISNQRVTFTPLNDETTSIVKEIFDLFINKWKTSEDIAETLNEKGVPSANGKKWNTGSINRILSNEVYTGTRVYNKTSGKLKQRKVKNPRNEWVVAPEAFQSIVSTDDYWKAQKRLFWSMPSRWKKGVTMVRKAQKFIEKEVKELLLKEGFSEDQAETKIKKIPLAYCVNSYEGDPLKKYTLFAIDEETRNFDKVFAVSITLDKKDPIDNLFLLPTSSFNQCNFYLFSELDQAYNEYIIRPEDVYQSIMPFIHKLKV